MNIFLFDFQVKGLSSSRVYQESRLEYIQGCQGRNTDYQEILIIFVESRTDTKYEPWLRKRKDFKNLNNIALYRNPEPEWGPRDSPDMQSSIISNNNMPVLEAGNKKCTGPSQ